MAKRKRNYKAEYARRKARAISLGYSSPKQMTKARKSVGLTRGFPTLSRRELPTYAEESLSGASMRRMRAANAAWAQQHSHVPGSRYKGNMSNQQTTDYYNAFAAPYSTYGPSRRKRAQNKRDTIKAYLKKYGFKIIEREDGTWKSETEKQ